MASVGKNDTMHAVAKLLTDYQIIAVSVVLQPPVEVGSAHGCSNPEGSSPFRPGPHGAAPERLRGAPRPDGALFRGGQTARRTSPCRRRDFHAHRRLQKHLTGSSRRRNQRPAPQDQVGSGTLLQRQPVSAVETRPSNRKVLGHRQTASLNSPKVSQNNLCNTLVLNASTASKDKTGPSCELSIFFRQISPPPLYYDGD
jgi:hypothetical protein